MKRLALVLVLFSSTGCDQAARFLVGGPPVRPALVARDRLLKCHPDWRAAPYGHDSTFTQRGYLTTKTDYKAFVSYETLGVLDQSPTAICKRTDLADLRGDKWRGVVFVRFAYGMRQDESPGWHGDRILVRNDCLFFGDKEMLKQIDKDLQ